MRPVLGKLREELINKDRIQIQDRDAFGSARHIKT